MIVSVFESQEAQMGLLQRSDLALVKTDKENWKGERMYKVSKSRFSSTGKLVPVSELLDFVHDYEEKLEGVK